MDPVPFSFLCFSTYSSMHTKSKVKGIRPRRFTLENSVESHKESHARWTISVLSNTQKESFGKILRNGNNIFVWIRLLGFFFFCESLGNLTENASCSRWYLCLDRNDTIELRKLRINKGLREVEFSSNLVYVVDHFLVWICFLKLTCYPLKNSVRPGRLWW